MSSALEALASLVASPAALAALLLGVFAGLLAGLTPGVSGRAGLLLVTPIALGFGPSAGAVFLIAFHSVVHTSGSIPAILLGAPTSASEAATAIDGYAMARRGEAARAVGATLTSSAFGGLVGALFLFLALPAALLIITHIATPEITALSVLGLLSIAALSGGWLMGGLLAAALGVLIASVGVDPFSAVPRLTFGAQGLWDGVNAAALVTGLLVVPELAARDPEAPATTPPLGGYSQVLKGCVEVVEHRWLMLRSSLIGVAVGVIPGLGASAAVWIAYGHARQTHRSSVPYGEGAIAGVIAPEAANNSKEGGSLVPTLFLGVPGSSGMGILLAAFATLGVEVGPRMLTKNPDLVFQLAWTNVAANLLAVPICLMMAPAMARFATLRRSEVVPVALGAALAATALTHASPATLIQLIVFSALGLLFKAANLPRAPLLLGFVLGPGLESGLIKSNMIYGWSALARPGVLAILTVAAMIVAASFWTRLRSGSRGPEVGTRLTMPVLGVVGALSASAVGAATALPATAAGILYLAGGAGLTTAGISAVGFWKQRASASRPQQPDFLILGLFLGAVAITGLVSLPLGVGAFVCSALVIGGGVSYRKAILIALLTAGAVLALESLQP